MIKLTLLLLLVSFSVFTSSDISNRISEGNKIQHQIYVQNGHKFLSYFDQKIDLNLDNIRSCIWIAKQAQEQFEQAALYGDANEDLLIAKDKVNFWTNAEQQLINPDEIPGNTTCFIEDSE